MLEILRHFWGYNRRYLGSYLGYIGCNALAVIAGGIVLPLYLRRLIDLLASSSGPHPEVLHAAYWLLGGVAAWSAFQVLVRYVGDRFILKFSPQVICDLENDCFEAVHRLPQSFFAGTQVGATVSKVSKFTNGYNTLDLHLTRSLLETSIQILATIAVVAWVDLRLALVFVVWGAVYAGSVLAAVRWKMRLDVDRVRSGSRVTAMLADSVMNFLAVKMFARFGSEQSAYRNGLDRLLSTMIRSWHASIVIVVIQGVIVGSALVVLLLLSVRLWAEGGISIGTVVLLQTYAIIISGHLMGFGDQLKAIYRAAADCVEMMEILKITPSVQDPASPEAPRMTGGAIRFSRVSFSHQADRALFDAFTLEIPAGQKVGLVGHSGAGKSTLFSLLLRFHDVRDGSITIDGQDIRAVRQDDLRAAIAYVPQDTLLFHRTIRENIVYAKPDATETEMIAAATHAHAHEFISGFPQGYDTVVGERGIRLSGGERQRIAIARAMLKDAPILLLDEATSSLDSVSERLIRDAFDHLVRGRTTLVIAHRLSTVQKMDRIVVLDHGRIAEDGTHDELLRKKGIYATLWEHQTDGFLGA